jgi:hypothetical protein
MKSSSLPLLALALAVSPFAFAQDAQLLTYDHDDPELRAQRDRQAQESGFAAAMRAGGTEAAKPLQLPMLELRSSALLKGARAASPEEEAPAAIERVSVVDESEGLWYAITDRIGDVSITVTADLRVASSVESLPAADAGELQIEVASPDDDAVEAIQARVVVNRFGGLRYVIDVECAPRVPLCYQRSALRALANSLELSYAPEETP